DTRVISFRVHRDRGRSMPPRGHRRVRARSPAAHSRVIEQTAGSHSLAAAAHRGVIRQRHVRASPVKCGRKEMTLKRMDNVLIVVEDLEAVKAFFVELGMELEGEMPVEGRWVDRVVGLENVRCEIAMMRTPDGHGRLELDKFHAPAAVRAEPKNAPVNTLGIRRIMFAVGDIEDVLAGLRAHGAEFIGEVAQYEDMYRLCYIRGPEGIIVALAEQLG